MPAEREKQAPAPGSLALPVFGQQQPETAEKRWEQSVHCVCRK